MKPIPFFVSSIVSGLLITAYTHVIENIQPTNTLCWLEYAIVILFGVLSVFLYSRFTNTRPISTVTTLLLGFTGGLIGTILYKLTYTYFQKPVTEPLISFLIYLAQSACFATIGAAISKSLFGKQKVTN